MSTFDGLLVLRQTFCCCCCGRPGLVSLQRGSWVCVTVCVCVWGRPSLVSLRLVHAISAWAQSLKLPQRSVGRHFSGILRVQVSLSLCSILAGFCLSSRSHCAARQLGRASLFPLPSFVSPWSYTQMEFSGLQWLWFWQSQMNCASMTGWDIYVNTCIWDGTDPSPLEVFLGRWMVLSHIFVHTWLGR